MTFQFQQKSQAYSTIIMDWTLEVWSSARTLNFAVWFGCVAVVIVEVRVAVVSVEERVASYRNATNVAVAFLTGYIKRCIVGYREDSRCCHSIPVVGRFSAN